MLTVWGAGDNWWPNSFFFLFILIFLWIYRFILLTLANMPQNGDDSCVWLQSGGQDSDCVKASAAQATPGRGNNEGWWKGRGRLLTRLKLPLLNEVSNMTLIFSIYRNMAYPRTLFFYRRSLSSLSSPDTPGRPESGAKHFAANHSPIIIYICCYTKTDDVDNKEKGSFKWHGPLNRTPLPSSGVSCWLTTFCPGFLFCLELPELET